MIAGIKKKLRGWLNVPDYPGVQDVVNKSFDSKVVILNRDIEAVRREIKYQTENLIQQKSTSDKLMGSAQRVASDTTLAASDVLEQLSWFIKECKMDRERTEEKLREAEEKLKSMEEGKIDA